MKRVLTEGNNKERKIILMQSTIFILVLTLAGFAYPAKQIQGKSWPTELNTAKNANYLKELEQQVIHELNKVCSYPQRFANEYLEELYTAYSGKLYTYPGQYPVKSQEGIRPLEECIQVLQQTEPMPLLNPAEGLAKAANDFAADQQKNGGIGHIARNGSTPQRRIEKYGDWDHCSAEDLTYRSFEARQIVIAFRIDDGVPDRGQHKNILNPCFRFAGAGNRTHPSYLSMCVIDYAGAYKTK